ncbi:transcriptional regulator PpsR [Hydrogenophaga sp. RAC07]|uniref:transcriptional regulator PpsR n=1 Tax=Hydrogenophaga sp. RAC07 TaxID=1842537 RepID=UPI000856BA99|nr:transcriptional regulator PpsR [Hydrogenophaga sp. RAC07]AOF85081.1 transcriptional regulator PpsR [Hydrogenophaga sp. RAC07]
MSQASQAYVHRPFDKADPFLAGLDADAAAELVTASADVVLILDNDGVIRDLALMGKDMMGLGCHEWIGKPWSQTVTVESKPKIEDLLGHNDKAGADNVRWRHVNHPMSDRADLPLSYSVVQVHRKTQGKADEVSHSVAFGRDLRGQVALQQRLVTAQQSMERDYWRLRQVETRYRLLFQMASEPVLILEGSIDKLEEANPAAHELFGEPSRLPGWTLLSSLDEASQTAVREMLDRLRASGRADPCTIRLVDSNQDMVVAASQFRQENTLHFLLRFTRPMGMAAPSLSASKRQLLQVMESAPDALVVTDLDGRILSANRAFLELGQLGSEDQARGEVLEKWLGRTGVDFRVLLTNLRQHGSVRLFATQLRGEYGSTSEVEISAVAVNAGSQRCLGFTIRDVGRRLGTETRASKELPRSASQMTELVGRLPLKDIVRETTDLIEQLCIEAALELTGDNRASAAEMLGLSRQSLYIKLRRFGILEGVSEDTH